MVRENLAEMKAVDREGNSQRKEPRPPEQGPEKELPIMVPLSADNAEAHHGLNRRIHVAEAEAYHLYSRGAVFLQKLRHPRVIVFR